MIQAAARQGVFEPEEITLALGFAMSMVLDLARDSGARPATVNMQVILATEIMIAVARLAPMEREIGIG